MPNALSYGLPIERPGAVPVFASYSAATLGPHATVARFTYTVPSGRRAQVTHALAHRMQEVVAGTPGASNAQIQPAGGRFLVYVTQLGAAAGVSNAQVINGLGPYLVPGQQVIGYTGDAGVGGSATYVVQLNAVEWIDSQ